MKFFLTFLMFTFFTSITKSQGLIGEWQKSTVSLGIIDSTEEIKPDGSKVKKPIYKVVGTGVIFYIKIKSNVIPVLVTAKHIFEDTDRKWTPSELQIRFSWFDDKPVDEFFGFTLPLIEKGKKSWFPHENNDVDLAGKPLFIPEGSDIGAESIKSQPYNQIAVENEFFEGANVFVLGYPGAIGSEYWTKALVRQGIISWVSRINPTANKILIDCDVFPGNSGGPVFYVPFGLGKDGKVQTGGEIKFMGIISQRRFSRVDVLNSRNNSPIFLDSLGTRLVSFESIGIGVVEPATRVRELLLQIEEHYK